MSDQADLFGHGLAQGSLFGTGDDRLQAPRQRSLPDPEIVRRRLKSLIEKARAAEKMPWSERDSRMWQTVFPNMAKWLPDDEAGRLCLEFTREMERLLRAR
jgi:hypothetical protein